MNKIYCYNVHSGGGLEMKQICKILSVLTVKNDKLIGIVQFDNSYI